MTTAFWRPASQPTVTLGSDQPRCWREYVGLDIPTASEALFLYQRTLVCHLFRDPGICGTETLFEFSVAIHPVMDICGVWAPAIKTYIPTGFWQSWTLFVGLLFSHQLNTFSLLSPASFYCLQDYSHHISCLCFESFRLKKLSDFIFRNVVINTFSHLWKMSALITQNISKFTC